MVDGSSYTLFFLFKIEFALLTIFNVIPSSRLSFAD